MKRKINTKRIKSSAKEVKNVEISQNLLELVKKIEEKERIKRLYSPYCIYPSNDSPTGKLMFIMENPGTGIGKIYEPLLKNENDMYEDWVKQGTTTSLEKFIEACREVAKLWFIKENKHFWPFFQMLIALDASIITPKKTYSEYIKENFFKDFWMTDCIKGRIKAFTEFYKKKLEDEIKMVQPRLIFLFGGDAWRMFHKIFQDQLRDQIREAFPDLNYEKIKLIGIKKVHGELFSIKISPTNPAGVIPLIHFVKTSFYPSQKIYFPKLEELFKNKKGQIKKFLGIN